MNINKNLKIAILTYNKPHKKSRDLYYGLKKKGYRNISILEKKFKKYKERSNINFIKHRPKMIMGKSLNELFKNKRDKIYTFQKKTINKFDYIIIGGSGIIEKKFIKKNLYINCHSGLIPSSRGLDSAKWDILKNRVAGCTLHFIDSRTDLGTIISHKCTPILKKDIMSHFFKNHYRNEINMLINFEEHLNKPVILKLTLNKSNMRMNKINEILMIKNFKIWKLLQLNYFKIKGYI